MRDNMSTNTKLQEAIQTLKGLKEQAGIVTQILHDGINGIDVKLEDTEIRDAQLKINPKHLKVFNAYISSQNANIQNSEVLHLKTIK